MNEEISMEEIRPRFRLTSNLSIEEIGNKIKEALGRSQAECIGQVIHGHATIKMPVKDQHYWSPQLNMTLEKTSEGTRIRGLYGPRPEVWTMFVLFYTIIGLATLAVLVFGMSYMMLGQSFWVIWLVPVFLIIFLTLFLVANRGKSMGKDQIHVIHHFVEEAVGFPLIHEESY